MAKAKVFFSIILILLILNSSCETYSKRQTEDPSRESEENETESNLETDKEDKVLIKEEEEKVEKTTNVTREWILNYYDLSEDDVEDYDIDIMIKHGFLSDQDTTMRRYPNKEDFLESLPWLQEKAYEIEYSEELLAANNYTYLLEGDGPKPSSYDEIIYLGIESVWDDRQPNETDPTGKVSLLIDFEEKKIYYKKNQESVLDDIREADQVVELSNEDIDYIKNLMKNAGLLTWPSYYSEAEIYDNWKYGIESKDGQLYSNMVENLPENNRAWELFNGLFSYSVPHPQMSK